MNCNTSAAMTESIGAAAAAAAGPGTEIIALQPEWGVSSAEGYYDSFLSAAAVLDRITTLDLEFDALVMAGFGEHGREGARELLDVPVVDITEAAAMTAMLISPRFGVVTTLRRSVPQIHDSLLTAGLLSRCAAIDATELGVLELDSDGDRTLAAVRIAAERVIAEGAEAVVLGCAGMADVAEQLRGILGIPVIDGVAAAVKIAEGLVDLRLRTAKSASYAPPMPKARPGWPVSTHIHTRPAKGATL